MALATTKANVKFVEVISSELINTASSILSSTASIGTGDIVFIPTLHSIYHNGEYYGFTEAERKIIDNNNNALLNLLNNKVNDIKVNGSTIQKSSDNTTHLATVDIPILGTNIPIVSGSDVQIKSYIDTEITKAKAEAESSGVTKLTVTTKSSTLYNEAVGPVSIDIHGANIAVGSTMTGAIAINQSSTIAKAIQDLNTNLNTANTNISSNSGSIGNLQNIVHTIKTASATALTGNSWTSQELGHDGSKTTIYLNGSNIVVGGNDGITINEGSTNSTIANSSSIRDAIDTLASKISSLYGVDSEHITVINQLRDEIMNADGTTVSFLDKIGLLLDGFDGVVVSDATTAGGKNLSLATAVYNMIATSIAGTVNSFENIKFVSSTNANAGSSFSQGITSTKTNDTGTVNIVANDLVIGSTIATANTTAIASSDTISIALGKLQKNIANVASSAGDIDSFNKIVINSTTLSNPTTIQQTDTYNQTATFNIRATELILGASSNAGVVTLATTDTILAALNKLNSNTQTKLNSKLEKITINGQTHTTTGTSASVWITAQNASVGVGITNGAVEIKSGSTIATALQQLDVALKTTNTNLQTATTNLLNATTNLFNATTAINNQLVWYTL